MVMLAVHLDCHIGADHLQIARRRVCAWSFLRLTVLQSRGRRWEATWSRIVICNYAVCTFQIVRYGHVGGAFGWPNWSRPFANHTSLFLRLVIIGINMFVMPGDAEGCYMGRSLNLSL